MTNPNQDNVTLYTLQSFVGNHIKEDNLTSRQREAIDRLNNLRDEKFYELCSDISNEIYRRNGMTFDKSNKMWKKFSMLSDENFKNLVIDVLYVYYKKNPDKKIQEMPKFIENLETLINELKLQAEKENLIVKLDKLEFYGKVKEFIKYIQNYQIDQKVLDYMDKALDNEIGQESNHLLEVFGFPEILLDKIEHSNLLKSDKQNFNDFLLSKQKILDCLSKNEKGNIKKEFVKIFKNIIKSSQIPKDNIICFKDDIKGIVFTLETIKNCIDNDKDIDSKDIVNRLNGSINNVKKKTRENNLLGDDSRLFELESIAVNEEENIPTQIELSKIILRQAKELSSILHKIQEQGNVLNK